jgi:phosphoribosylformylglycinamidine cyclo-ligase
LPRNDITAGDIVLGLGSSGLHSNGFSLVRKIVAAQGLDWRGPAPFMAERSLAEALLTPTRIYVRPVLAALKECAGVKGLAHVTGGGFPENLPRVLPEGLGIALDLAAFEVPGVFRWLAGAGDVAEAEMLRTFNCGIGMVVIAEKTEAASVSRAFEAAGETPITIGSVVAAQGPDRILARGKLGL